MAGGDVTEIGQIYFGGLLLPIVAIEALAKVCITIFRAAPWATAPALAVIACIALRASRDTYRQIGSGLLEVLQLVSSVYTEYTAALERVEELTPLIPTWASLSARNAPRDVLARACLYHLARTNEETISAAKFAEALPELHVGQRAQLVRETLRALPSCSQPYAGRWQIGHAVRGKQPS